jgi:hypothetical protein
MSQENDRAKGGTRGEFAYRKGIIFTIRSGMVLSMVGYPNPRGGPRSHRAAGVAGNYRFGTRSGMHGKRNI